jgi:phage terminase small subunit
VKKKLFDPEIQYIMKKLRSILQDESEQMFKKTVKIIENSENSTRNDYNMVKSMCENMEQDFETNKKMNKGIS